MGRERFGQKRPVGPDERNNRGSLQEEEAYRFNLQEAREIDEPEIRH